MCYGDSFTPSDIQNRKEEIDNLYNIVWNDLQSSNYQTAYGEGFKAGRDSVSLISRKPCSINLKEKEILEYVIDCYTKKAKSSTTQEDEAFYYDIAKKLSKIKDKITAL